MKTSYVTVKTTSKTKKLSENKREQLVQQGSTGSEEERNPARRKGGLKKDEDGIVFDRDTDGQEQRLAERAQTARVRRGYRGDG